MDKTQQQRLNAIIKSLETVQAQAPTTTTYTMGRADHSISYRLLDIIRELKALAHDASQPQPDPKPDSAAGSDAAGTGKSGK